MRRRCKTSLRASKCVWAGVNATLTAQRDQTVDVITLQTKTLLLFELPMNCYERLRARGLTLPQVPTPIGNFMHCTREGDLLFLSGQGPLNETGTLMTGKVGATVTAGEANGK